MSAPKAFVIVQIVVHDPAGYRRYQEGGHAEIFEKFGATLVGLDENVDIVEGSWPYMRTVILEFPDKERAHAWHESQEYQAIAGWRHSSATTNLVIVSGFPG